MTTIDFRNDPSSGSSKILNVLSFGFGYSCVFRTVPVDIICYTIITSVMKDRFQTESKISQYYVHKNCFQCEKDRY